MIRVIVTFKLSKCMVYISYPNHHAELTMPHKKGGDMNIDDLTLRYFTNKEFSSKLQKDKQSMANRSIRRTKEVRFYSKRVVEMTRNLLALNKKKDKEDTTDVCEENAMSHVPQHLQDAFSCYVDQCIEYFQSIDMCDILQHDLQDVVTNEATATRDTVTTDMNPSGKIDADNAFVKSIRPKPQHGGLNQFILRKHRPDQQTPAPRQRDVNLTDPALKNKGVRKKKNIDSTHEDQDQKKQHGS